MSKRLSRRRVVTSCAVAAMAVGVVGVGTASADYHTWRHRHHPWPVPSPTATSAPAPTTTTEPAPPPTTTHSHTTTTPAEPTTTSTTTTTTTSATVPPSTTLPKPSGVVYSDHVAEFNVLCSADHYAADDPIVYPGQPGKAHMHTFYGNTSTDASSTLSASRPPVPRAAAAEWAPATSRRTGSHP